MTCIYSQATIKSKYSSLLSCASSGFHLLLDTALTDDISSHSLSEVGCYYLPTIMYVIRGFKSVPIRYCNNFD